jgi:hypothetical protein
MQQQTSTALKFETDTPFKGEYLIVGVDFRAEVRAALEHLRRRELRQVPSVDPQEVRRILLAACPCWEMEHRMGLCPLGLDHRTEDHEGKNQVVNSLRKSLIDQMVGNANPTNLLITRIATGTNAGQTSLVAPYQLGAETYRDAPTFLDDMSASQLQTNWYFGPAVGNPGTNLQEWGIFAGGADGTANSGIMLARFLQLFDKVFGKAASGQYIFNAT